MSDTVMLTPALVQQARDYYDEHGLPDLREPQPGERCFFVGWSNRQEQYVLLAEDNDDSENYEDAESAYWELRDFTPATLLCNDELVGRIDFGFLDFEGTETNEITLAQPWLATLIQHVYDQEKRDVCLRMTSGQYLAERLDQHIRQAQYALTAKGRFASFQHMSIRRELGDYVRQYVAETGTLPVGPHTLDSGVHVNFPQEAE